MIHISPRKTDCFANPEKFDLENFTESDSFNKFGFNSFGQGPRSCIGKLSNSLWFHIILISSGRRYAVQTVKIAIIQTVRRFRLVKCDETTEEDQLRFSVLKNSFVGDIKFRVEKLLD